MKSIFQKKIMDRVIPVTESGCWLWTGCCDRDGYGTLSHYSDGKRKRYRAHRASYFAFKGHVPDDLFVCHKCDVPGCVNPDHLFLGTALDNTRDMIEKGRDGYRAKETHCTMGHLITPENQTTNGRCRICNKRRSNSRYAKHGKNGERANVGKSGMIGVHYKRSVDRWVAHIDINKKRIHLGTFRFSLDAYAARKSAELKYADQRLKQYQIASK